MNRGRHEELLARDTPPIEIGEIIEGLDTEEVVRLRDRTLSLYDNLNYEVELRGIDDDTYEKSRPLENRP